MHAQENDCYGRASLVSVIKCTRENDDLFKTVEQSFKVPNPGNMYWELKLHSLYVLSCWYILLHFGRISTKSMKKKEFYKVRTIGVLD